ncbi:hypothetical protein Bca4012_081032 [Brassica carinata]
MPLHQLLSFSPGVFDALGVKERGQLIYEDIEDYLNQRKQHLNKLQRMLSIGICVNVAGILFTGTEVS